MIGSKLLQQISNLEAWDIRHLRDFVHSPFFNKHARLTILMDLLLDMAPDFKSEELERNRLYAQIFPDATWDEQKWKDLLSMGVKLMRQFRLQMRLKDDPDHLEILQLEEFLRAGEVGDFQRAMAKREGMTTAGDSKLQEMYLKRLLIQELWISHQAETGSRKADDSLQRASDQLDGYYLLSKLKYGVEMANRAQVVSQEFDPGLLNPALAYLETRPHWVEQHPGIRAYLLIWRCLNSDVQDKAFVKLLELIRSDAQSFPQSEQREIQAYALNHCIRQVNKGRREFLDILVDLYQTALESGTLVLNGVMSQWDYKNIVSAGLKAGKYQWCEDFIEGYKDKIEADHRENAYTYNLASLHFEQGEYKKALRLLQHVEFSDVFYHLGAKVMLLKAYYELEDEDALKSLSDTFRMYLKRNKTLSKAHFTVNYNLIGLTWKLHECRRKSAFWKPQEKWNAIQSLRKDISEAGQVAQIGWLMAMVEKLEME